MKPGTSDRSIERVIQQVALYNVRTETKICQQQVTIVLFGNTDRLNPEQIQAISPDIETVLPIPHPFKRASLEFRHGEYSEIVVPTPHGDVAFGKNAPLVNVAGPCSVESEQMILDTAFQLKAAGAQFLRGGAYKPRTSPYDFQGHGELAIEWLATARRETGLVIAICSNRVN
jgi:3-deoxy-7-phosphoheptulonate synthase